MISTMIVLYNDCPFSAHYHTSPYLKVEVYCIHQLPLAQQLLIQGLQPCCQVPALALAACNFSHQLLLTQPQCMQALPCTELLLLERLVLLLQRAQVGLLALADALQLGHLQVQGATLCDEAQSGMHNSVQLIVDFKCRGQLYLYRR